MGQWIQKWRYALKSRQSLDVIFSHIPAANAPIRRRLDWVYDLLQWIRSAGILKSDLDFKSGSPQAARMRYLIQILERNPQWREETKKMFSSIVQDTKALDLFTNTGVPQQESFWSEFSRRLNKRILPQIHNDVDLTYFFDHTFYDIDDATWVAQIDVETFQYFANLFDDHAGSLRKSAYDAMILLAIQIEGLGFNKTIRSRIQAKHFSELPFYKIVKQTQSVIEETNPEKQLELCYSLDRSIDNCFFVLREVYDHLGEHGVSVSIIYQLERMEAWLKRLQTLLYLVVKHADDPVTLLQFVRSLVEDNINQRSIRALFSENFSLLSKKIAERSAETGEHYISRDFKEFRIGLKAACGGGVITAFTVFVKSSVAHLSLAPFIAGVFQTVNFSISFLAIHFAGFTLATKQPAMTATALAAKMHKVRDEAKLQELVREITHLIRSQTSAVMGNITAVIPMVLLICFATTMSMHEPPVNTEKALKTLSDFSILGPTPLYAAFTGVLLWLSSLAAGIADNWFAFHKLEQAISQNRRLRFVFGDSKSRGFAIFLRRNIAAFAGNISLAMFLGILPPLLWFFGVPLDVRHITLSTGALTAALWTLCSEHGWSILISTPMILATFGILSMAIFNIGVAFALAFIVAVRARRVMAPERSLIYRALWKHFKKNPIHFFIPLSK